MSRLVKRSCNKMLGLFVMASIPLLMAQGCPPPTGNNAPSANAGTDQSVVGGSTVSLDASSSSDPDGDPLSFLWTQSTGTPVALSNASSAQASFTAPNSTETLTFEVEVMDGSGASDTDTVSVSVTTSNQNPVNPGNPTNNLPVANAGFDQSVSGGSTVSLNGSASFDPDGDPLTYNWSQTTGTPVTLSDSSSATPSFTAPNSTETMSFSLTVSDGFGSSTDSVNVIVTQTTSPMLYIANFNGSNVTAYDISDPNAINGNIAPDANLQGAQTQLFFPSDIIIDAGGALLASNFATQSITGYDDAINLPSINGNVAPTRNVQGAATLLSQPTSVTVNTFNDLAFVADLTTDQIYVYGDASTPAFNGNLPPTRTITSANINNPLGINFGANDDLYVANNGVDNVTVFANASNLNGVVAATRTINSATFNNLFDVYVDPNDTMYVVNSTTGQIDMFFNASILNGNVAPDVSLVVQGAGSLTAIAVDQFGTAYIVDNPNNAVYSYDNITTRNGTLPPDRVLQGANTQLFGPIRVFLQE